MKKINQITIYLHEDAIDDRYIGEKVTDVLSEAMEHGWYIDIDDRLVNITDKEHDKLVENADHV